MNPKRHSPLIAVIFIAAIALFTATASAQSESAPPPSTPPPAAAQATGAGSGGGQPPANVPAETPQPPVARKEEEQAKVEPPQSSPAAPPTLSPSAMEAKIRHTRAANEQTIRDLEAFKTGQEFESMDVEGRSRIQAYLDAMRDLQAVVAEFGE